MEEALDLSFDRLLMMMMIQETMNTKFLGLRTDNHANCKNQIEHMILILNKACNAVRSVGYISNNNTPKSIYIKYFHSLKKY